MSPGRPPKIEIHLPFSGLSPEILQQVLLERNAPIPPSRRPSTKGKEKETDPITFDEQSPSERSPHLFPRIIYELDTDSDEIEPRLRLLTDSDTEFAVALPVNPSSSPRLTIADEAPPDLAPPRYEIQPDEIPDLHIGSSASISDPLQHR